MRYIALRLLQQSCDLKVLHCFLFSPGHYSICIQTDIRVCIIIYDLYCIIFFKCICTYWFTIIGLWMLTYHFGLYIEIESVIDTKYQNTMANNSYSANQWLSNEINELTMKSYILTITWFDNKIFFNLHELNKLFINLFGMLNSL